MRTVMKRLATLTAAAVMMVSAGGCGSKTSDESSEDSTAETVIPEFSIPDNILGAPSDKIPDVSVDKFQIPDNEGMTLMKNLKLGWNLGNTFDASNMTNIGAANELDYEKAWCGQITTIETIAAVKGAGFETIRIPVSWHNHVDAEYHISEVWMKRVKEVVDWARACDLYVILNTHHDNEEKYYYPDTAHMEQSEKYLSAVWTQIADTFKDYDDHLILESMNEPRLVGTNVEWWLDQNKQECIDSAECINKLNQKFVDIVRKSGGNNDKRWLLVPGYAAAPESAIYDGFKLPEDPAKRIIVSVHAYRPYNFALNKTGTNEWSASNTSDCTEITKFMDDLYGKFILNGTPVLIGEFGAMNKDNLQARIDFSVYYTAAARAHGISCIWWDNNAFSGSGENFGLLFRSTSTFTSPEIVQALVKGSEY